LLLFKKIKKKEATMSTCHTSVEIPDEKIINDVELLYQEFTMLTLNIKDVVANYKEQPKYDYLMRVARLSAIVPHIHAHAIKEGSSSWPVLRLNVEFATSDSLGYIKIILLAMQKYDMDMKVVSESLSRLLVDLAMAYMQHRLSPALKTFMDDCGLKILAEVLLVKFSYDTFGEFQGKLQTNFLDAVYEMYACTLENAVKANLEQDQFKLIVTQLFSKVYTHGFEAVKFIWSVYSDWAGLNEID